MRGIYSRAKAVTLALAQASAYFGLSVGFIKPVIPEPLFNPATNFASLPVIDNTRSASLQATLFEEDIVAPADL